jgi:xylulose-5-phosphate/fructose-6-phosphate phosphoketolase
LPPDANTFLSTIAYCFKSKNYVNLMAGSKQPSAVFLTADEAENHRRRRGSI